MNNADFSVSICVYGGDKAREFDCAMQSIVDQTIKPKEIVLVVDGPIPSNIEEVITRYSNILTQMDIEYIIIKLKDNKGHGEARRIGLANCTSDIIALMDSDDICENTRFEKQIDFLNKNQDITIVGGQIIEFVSNENDPSDISQKAGMRYVPETDEEIKKCMKKRCPMNQVTVMFRKTDIEEVGGYIDWYCEEDYYLWLRLALARKKFGNLDHNLVNVRVGKDMYKRRGGLKYFRSEAKLQKYMLNNGIINIYQYCINIFKRLTIQVLLPNNIRSWVFKKIARKRG